MINEIIKDLVRDVHEGHENALAVYGRLKQLEMEVKQAISDIYDLTIDECDKHGEKSFKSHGFKFEKRNGKRTFHFDHIPDYVEANKFMKELKQKYTDAYVQSEKGNTLVDENGEVLPMAQVTYAKDAIIVKPE